MTQTLAVLALLLSPADAEVEKARAQLKKAASELNVAGVRDASDALGRSDQKPAVDALLDGYGICASIVKGLWPDKLRAIQQKEANADFRVNLQTNPPTIVQGDEKKYLA